MSELCLNCIRYKPIKPVESQWSLIYLQLVTLTTTKKQLWQCLWWRKSKIQANLHVFLDFFIFKPPPYQPLGGIKGVCWIGNSLTLGRHSSQPFSFYRKAKANEKPNSLEEHIKDYREWTQQRKEWSWRPQRFRWLWPAFLPWQRRRSWWYQDQYPPQLPWLF